MAGFGGDEEEIEELGVTGAGGGFGELLVVGEHVEEGGLADVGAPDEGDFGEGGVGAGFEVGSRGEEGGLGDLHGDFFRRRRKGGVGARGRAVDCVVFG